MEIWISLAASITAAIFSLLSYLQSKRALASEVVSKQRLEWMESVRLATFDYIVTVRNPSSRDDEIQSNKNKVELYLNPCNEAHIPFLTAINKCATDKDNIPILIAETQKLCNSFWRMIKIEAGVTDSIQAKNENKVKR